ncbi:MAG: divalent metal cation transporter [Bacteroidota bacterium]|nr:divalent metal cation transporter [Candidatus Kapabacteria bacterium]MDW8220984.1 divalent metal cation transporter [Bacteroidota bacterium]
MNSEHHISRGRGHSGAALLMATSAIGPGFLTQTAVFTQKFGANIAASIALSVLLDVIVQIAIWRVIIVSGKRAQDVANTVVRGSGTVLALVVAIGGFIFTIGNVAGAGLGMMSMSGLPSRVGAVLSAIVAITLFFLPTARAAVDKFVALMAAIMFFATLAAAIAVKPPLYEVSTRVFMLWNSDIAATLTLVGGTVGGYITFAGAHRLVDAGIVGEGMVRYATTSAVWGIGIASCMRIFLFLAVLGSVMHEGRLSNTNPAATPFSVAFGTYGTQLFGMVMWAASMTSIIGSTYTSLSFLRSLSRTIERYERYAVGIFIGTSALLFVSFGQPISILIFAGLVNSFVLPFALAIMLSAAYKTSVVGAYKQPLWVTVVGSTIAVLLTGMSMYAVLCK